MTVLLLLIRYGFATLLLCACTVNVYAQSSSKAYIKITLDSTEIFAGDTVVLEIESTGLLDPLDLSVITEQAQMIRETVGTRIAVIGGKVAEIKIRRIDLIPKNTGIVVIGPLISGDIRSNAVHINVLDAQRPDWQPAEDDFQIKTSLTNDTIWLNQQALLTIDLLHRYPISNEQIKLPDLSNFTTRELLSNQRTFIGTDREWFQTRWQYLIFPRQSGKVAIEEITWSGMAGKSQFERAEFSRKAEALFVNVKPTSNDAGQWWLPAGNLQLDEQWSQAPTNLRAGDEIYRTLRVRATNVLASQIPTPQVPESRALQQTLLDTDRQETLETNSVVSVVEFKYRVKAQSPVPVFLDTVRMRWWNTQLNTPEEEIIPARRINVGLPDRADVLSKIALEEPGVSRWKHRLQSVPGSYLLSMLLSLVALAVLLHFIAPPFMLKIKHKIKLHKHFKGLMAAAKDNNAGQLYQLLKQTESVELLNGVEHPLLKHLEQQLFSKENNTSTQDLPKRLNIVKKAVLQQKKPPKPTAHKATLAEL